MNKLATEHANLRNFRKHLGLTQITFANEVGLKQGSYSDIERGKVGISAELIKTLILKYQINPIWLYTGKGEMLLPSQNPSATANQMQKLKNEINLLQTKLAGLEREKNLLEKMLTLYEQKK